MICFGNLKEVSVIGFCSHLRAAHRFGARSEGIVIIVCKNVFNHGLTTAYFCSNYMDFPTYMGKCEALHDLDIGKLFVCEQGYVVAHVVCVQTCPSCYGAWTVRGRNF